MTIYGGHIESIDYRNKLMEINHAILSDAT